MWILFCHLREQGGNLGLRNLFSSMLSLVRLGRKALQLMLREEVLQHLRCIGIDIVQAIDAAAIEKFASAPAMADEVDFE